MARSRTTSWQMAGLIWRKQNLSTFRIAEFARQRHEQLVNEEISQNPDLPRPMYIDGHDDPDVREEARRAVEDEARKELGDTYELVEMGNSATVDNLMTYLDVTAVRLSVEQIQLLNQCGNGRAGIAL